MKKVGFSKKWQDDTQLARKNMDTSKENGQVLDEQDIRIEKGEEDPLEKDLLYPRGVLDALNIIYNDKKLPRPRGKLSPKLGSDVVPALVDFLFFGSPNVEIRVYKRLPKEREIPLKRRTFLNYFFGIAMFNGAKAARLAGYSVRSAKQIAYKLRHI